MVISITKIEDNGIKNDSMRSQFWTLMFCFNICTDLAQPDKCPVPCAHGKSPGVHLKHVKLFSCAKGTPDSSLPRFLSFSPGYRKDH